MTSKAEFGKMQVEWRRRTGLGERLYLNTVTDGKTGKIVSAELVVVEDETE